MHSYLLELVNASRAEAGVQALSFDAELVDAASQHSDWMDAQDVFSHTGANGSSAGDRIEAAGYDARGWGENIAYVSDRGAAGIDSADIEALHTNLMNSPGHRANLLNADFTEIGVGLTLGEYQGRDVVFLTEVFGRPTASEAAETDNWFI